MENFEKLNFIVGVNGSGKSRYLNRLAEFFDSRDNNVLEISNTVFDRFYFCSNNIKKLKINNGRDFFLKSLLSVFGRENYDRANDDIYKQLKLISQVFTYIGYSSEIKVDFSLKGEDLKINFFDLDVNFLINESKKYYKDRQDLDLDFVFDDFEEVLYWGKYFFKDSGVVFNFDDDHYLNNNLKKFSKIFHFFNSLNFVDFNFYLKKIITLYRLIL